MFRSKIWFLFPVTVFLFCFIWSVNDFSFIRPISTDVFQEMEVYRYLYALPYTEFVKTDASVCRNLFDDVKISNFDKLKQMVKERKEEENIFLLNEDFLFDENPRFFDKPFYLDETIFPVSRFTPYSELLLFNNMRLSPVKQDLIKIAEDYYISSVGDFSETGSFVNFDERKYEYSALSLDVDNMKTVRIPQEKLFLLAKSSRQWYKLYEDSLVTPHVFDDSLLVLRNEYRAFFYDIKSGKEVFSYSPYKKEGYEDIVLYRRMHINTGGHELYADETHFISEFSGKLACLYKNAAGEYAEWRKSLGEYSLCTKPIKVNGSVICGLINNRSELWFIAFDLRDGSVNWSSYIGISSYLTLPSTLIKKSGNTVYCATNHGVILSLNADTGMVNWKRKYTPKKNSVFTYWLSFYYHQYVDNKGRSAFDTDFLSFGKDGNLYVKVRDSDTMLTLNAESGELVSDLFIDTSRFYCLAADQMRAVLYNKKNGELVLVDLAARKEVMRKKISRGGAKFYGSCGDDRGNRFVKVSGNVFYLQMSSDFSSFEVSPLSENVNGWLKGIVKDQLVFTEGNTFYYGEVINGLSASSANPANGSDVSDKSIEALLNILPVSSVDLIPQGAAQSILRKIETGKSSLNELLLTRLRNLLGDEIVKYKGINIRFSEYLNECFPEYSKANNPKVDMAMKVVFDNGNDGLVRADSENIRMAPVISLKGKPQLFCLLYGYNQAVMLDVKGEVRWERRVFHYPRTLNTMNEMLANDFRVYYYEGVYIFKDNLNVCAYSEYDGTLIWSVSNDYNDAVEGRWARNKQKDQELYTKFRSESFFVNKLQFLMDYDDGLIYLTHRNTVKALDPLTGFCRESVDLPVPGFYELIEEGGRIYCLSSDCNRIFVLNSQLEIIKNIPIQFACPHDYADMFYSNDHLFIQTEILLVCLDPVTGQIIGEVPLDDCETYNVVETESGVLIINAAESIAEVDVLNKTIVYREEFFPAERVYREKTLRDEFSFFKVRDDMLLALARESDNVMLRGYNSHDLGVKWSSDLPGISESLHRFSTPVKIDDWYYFIVSFESPVSTSTAGYKTNCEHFYIETNMYRVNIDSGKIDLLKEFPPICEAGAELPTLTYQKGKMCYVINANHFYMESVS